MCVYVCVNYISFAINIHNSISEVPINESDWLRLCDYKLIHPWLPINYIVVSIVNDIFLWEGKFVSFVPCCPLLGITA